MIILVVTLLGYGCPVVAIVAALAIDERTVMGWQGKVGAHAQAVQAQLA